MRETESVKGNMQGKKEAQESKGWNRIRGTTNVRTTPPKP
jgi:hypothetical protein